MRSSKRAKTSVVENWPRLTSKRLSAVREMGVWLLMHATQKACPNSLWSCAGQLRLAVNGGVVHFGVSVSCQICIVRRRLRLMRRSVPKPAKDQARRHQPAVAPAPFLL